MIIFIRTTMCRDRETRKKQYNEYSSQNTKVRKTSQTDALNIHETVHTQNTLNIAC